MLFLTHRRPHRRLQNETELSEDVSIGRVEILRIRHFRAQLLSRLGGVIAAAGIVWTLNAAFHHPAEIVRFGLFPPGPLEVLGTGILLWLFAERSFLSQRRKTGVVMWETEQLLR